MSASTWFLGWLTAFAILVALCLSHAARCWRLGTTVASATAAVTFLAFFIALLVFANFAVTRHDLQIDFTSEQSYSLGADNAAIISALKVPVTLTYFYHGEDEEGRRARRLVEEMGRQNSLLQVLTVDPDKDPSLSQTSGVKLYNAALIESSGRRLIVQSTQAEEIVVGIQRLLRRSETIVCFWHGHGEYPSDNYEFHTHTEALDGGGGHSHGSHAEIETTAHGVGRLRRALESLGFAINVIVPAANGVIDRSCNVVIDAGPRTPYAAAEVLALEQYLNGGGAAFLLYDIGLDVSHELHHLLLSYGVELAPAVFNDPVQHYAGDHEMVAVTSYEKHAITDKLSYAFFPGARPLILRPPPAGVSNHPLVEVSKDARAVHLEGSSTHGHHHGHAQTAIDSRVIAIAAERSATKEAPRNARLVVFGDSDFASNSFFPYMSNSRLALSIVKWLLREEPQLLATAPKDTTTLALNVSEQRRLFVLLVGVLPFCFVAAGAVVWWRRRA